MVETVPHKVTAVSYDVENSSNTEIIVNWDAVTGLATGGSPILEYTVEFDQGTGAWISSTTTDTTATFITLTGGVTYSFKVAAANKYGTGDSSDTL